MTEAAFINRLKSDVEALRAKIAEYEERADVATKRKDGRAYDYYIMRARAAQQECDYIRSSLADLEIGRIRSNDAPLKTAIDILDGEKLDDLLMSFIEDPKCQDVSVDTVRFLIYTELMNRKDNIGRGVRLMTYVQFCEYVRNRYACVYDRNRCKCDKVDE